MNIYLLEFSFYSNPSFLNNASLCIFSLFKGCVLTVKNDRVFRVRVHLNAKYKFYLT